MPVFFLAMDAPKINSRRRTMPKEDKTIVKYAPPARNLPVYRQVDPEEVSFIGRTNYEASFESDKFIFGIKRKDRKKLLYIVGKTGVGKSKLIELLMRQDITYGYGCCLIDPYGNVIDEILKFIPEDRAHDVVVIDPSDTAWPVSFNPFERVADELKQHMAREIIEIMRCQFGAHWNLRLEHIVRFSVLALLEYPGATLSDIVSLLTDPEYREKIMLQVTDGTIRKFFTSEFSEWVKKYDADAVMPVVNRMRQFLSVPAMYHIFSRRENSIDFSEIIEKRKILLINLSKDTLGDENAIFFGSLLIAKIRHAGMTRAHFPEEEKEDFYFYADEFNSLATESFAHLLTEGKRYGFNIAIAHQYMAQLSPKMCATVLGNMGHLIVFRVGGDDAVRLEPEMAPVFKARDMINLAKQEFYIKETIDGESYDPFSANLLRVLSPRRMSAKNRIIEFSRNHYAYPLGVQAH